MLHKYFKEIKSFYNNYIQKTVLISNSFYHSWIPTNLGNISFDLIAREYRLDEETSMCYKNRSEDKLCFIDFKPHLTDLMSLKTNRLIYKNSKTDPLEKQNNPIVYINLEFHKNTNTYSGQCYIYFVSSTHYTKLIKELHNTYTTMYKIRQSNHSYNADLDVQKKYLRTFFNKLTWGESKTYRNKPLTYHSCDFSMKGNGKITLRSAKISAITFNEEKFQQSATDIDQIIQKDIINLSCVSLSDIQTLFNTDMHYIVQSLYTVIKRLIHGDNHHHHKLDTIIPVLEGSFNPKSIYHSMANRLKEIEVTIREGNTHTAQDDASKAKGLKSYISTFICLFLKNEKDALLCPIQSVEESIVATSQRHKQRKKCKEIIIDHIKATVPWILSALILLNGLAIFISSNQKHADPDSQIVPSKIGMFIFQNYLEFPIITISILAFLILMVTLLTALFNTSCAIKYYENYVGADRLMTISNVAIHRKKALLLGVAISLLLLYLADILDGEFNTLQNIEYICLKLFGIIIPFIHQYL